MAANNSREPGAKRFKEFDIVRSAVMLYVVGYWHLSEYSEALSFLRNQATLIAAICSLGVLTYVSGFLISRLYGFTRISEVPVFFKKRLLRIYPPYIITLSLFLLLGYTQRPIYVKSIFMLNMILNTPVMTLWFISCVVVYYLIAPIYIYKYNILKAIAVTVVIYAALLFLHQRTGYIDLRLPQYLIPFVFGIVAGRSKPAGDGSHRWIKAALCLAGVIIVGYLHGKADNEILKTILLDIAILCAVPVAMEIASRISSVVDGGRIAAFSYCTFAMYLSHRIIYGTGERFYRPESLIISLLYLVLLLLPVTVALSYVFQKSYDSIIRKLKV
jgi:peptidoglycan/LPS O-acetylase OafA/YrhL